MKKKELTQQIKAGLPDAVGVVAKAAADALLHFDTGGKIAWALVVWAAGKQFKGKKKRRKAVVARKQAQAGKRGG